MNYLKNTTSVNRPDTRDIRTDMKKLTGAFHY
jgi:hypothetical protein